MESWPQSALSLVTNVDATTLARLEDLEIYQNIYSEGEHLTPFLRRLRLPALKILRIDFCNEAYSLQWSALAFTQFQMRAPQIEHLELTSCSINSDELRAVLRHAVDLKHLELMDCRFDCIDDETLAVLQYKESDSAHLAPKLETLLLGAAAGEFDEEKFEAMVDSRWWTDEELLSIPTPAVARLKHVHYWDGQQFTRGFIERMDRYRTEGLDLGEFEPEE
ncbi:hypothetical protein DFH09DRAFT_1302581 [Mycena vulgaris]|nr:hypothetical protein DFH09DRAFT_1302581 [Mycena vulgaris]